MIHFETERLILRNYRPEDLDDYYDYMRLEFTARYETFSPLTRAETKTLLESRLGRDDYWFAWHKADQRVIGDVSYTRKRYENYEIGYDFHEAYTGQGYATEACRVLVDHLFRTIGARRLTAECDDVNDASWHLLEKLGFRREGFFIEDVAYKRDAEGKPIYLNSYYYALLQREWLAMKKDAHGNT